MQDIWSTPEGVVASPLLQPMRILTNNQTSLSFAQSDSFLLLSLHYVQEGEDKKFLITRLQSIHEQKRTPTRRLTSQVCARF